jgi:hypothetical protein
LSGGVIEDLSNPLIQRRATSASFSIDFWQNIEARQPSEDLRQQWQATAQGLLPAPRVSPPIRARALSRSMLKRLATALATPLGGLR